MKLLACLASLASVAFASAQSFVNTPTTPNQLSFYSSAGATMVVEVRSAYGTLVPLVDSVNAKWSNATVTLPGAQAEGLGWALQQVTPDSSHNLSALTASAWSVVVRITSGTATMTTSGTSDGSAGSGYGLGIGLPAPNASSPTVLVSGITYQINPGGAVVAAAPGSSSIVSISSSALLKTNGASVFSLWSTSEASNNITSTPAAITTTGGGGPIVRAYVICTNTGTTKVWIAACSGGHTFPLPAGSQIYVPAATGVSLYALAPPGSTSTVVCSEVGY